MFRLPTIVQIAARTYLTKFGEKRVQRPNFRRPKPRDKKQPNGRIIWPDAESVESRGFLRPQSEYIPPSDVELKLNDLFNTIVGVTERKTLLKDNTVKYSLLEACYEEFNHKVPNSILFKINTLDDVFNYYLTPVDVRTPLEAMKTADLPPNLHILYEYKRFHPDDDTLFNGVTAFPESNTVVSSLRHKKKYKEYVAPRPKPVYKDEFEL